MNEDPNIDNDPGAIRDRQRLREIMQMLPLPPKPTKNPNAVALGRLGGKAGKGKVKARTTEQARAAVMVRWSKRTPKS